MKLIKFYILSPFFLLVAIIIFHEIMAIYLFWKPSFSESIQLVIYHILLGSIIFTFYLTMTKESYYEYSTLNQQIEEESSPIRKRTCKFCQTPKPPRCHHCRQCNKCILRMDHHCQWVNNCIGINNYKCFFCLVLYSTITIIYYSCFFFYKLLQIEEFGYIELYPLVFTQALAITLSIVLTLFLGFHIKLISKNQTTLEFFEKSENYNNGLFNNINEFLGPNFWFIPI